jgi:hypothetical protein
VNTFRGGRFGSSVSLCFVTRTSAVDCCSFKVCGFSARCITGFLLAETKVKRPEIKGNQIVYALAQVFIQQSLHNQFTSQNEEVNISKFAFLLYVIFIVISTTILARAIV